jgi:hypothetical protein
MIYAKILVQLALPHLVKQLVLVCQNLVMKIKEIKKIVLEQWKMIFVNGLNQIPVLPFLEIIVI